MKVIHRCVVGIAVGFSIVGLVPPTATAQPVPTRPTGRSLIVTEISPVASPTSPAWIELYNPLDREIDVSGSVLGFSVNTEIELTGDIPWIPPGAISRSCSTVKGRR